MKNQCLTRAKTVAHNFQSSVLSLYSILLVIGFILSTSQAQSQTLSDFASAAGKSKMGVIPYSSLKSQIVIAQRNKDDASRAVAGYKIRDITNGKENTLRIITEVKEQLANAKKELADYDGDSSSEKSKLSAAVTKQQNDLKMFEKELAAQNEKIKTAGEKWEDVYDARMVVKTKYIAVKDALQKSLSYPTSHIGSKPSSSDVPATKKYESDLKSLKAHIATIKSKMNTEFSSHQTLIDKAKENQKKYESLYKVK